MLIEKEATKSSHVIKKIFCDILNWRASETLTGVTQLNIGDACLLCLDVRKAFLYFDPRVFVLVRWSTPSQTSLNRILCLSISTRINLEIVVYHFEFFYGSS